MWPTCWGQQQNGMEKISPANMAIVALEGHEVRILHVDSRRRCVGVTRYFKLYFNTDFKFERTLDFCF